jgi:hypothetical protein
MWRSESINGREAYERMSLRKSFDLSKTDVSVSKYPSTNFSNHNHQP